jgi:AraC-like DNA-binding protein
LSAELRELGLLYYIAASSERLGDALARMARYCAVVNEGLSISYLAGRDSHIVIDYVGVARRHDIHQIEFAMTALMRVCRHLTDRRLTANRIGLTHHRSDDCSEISAFFGGEADFGVTMDEIAFDASVGDLPVVSADPHLNELLIAFCEEALSRRPAAQGSLRAAVENAIVPLLPHGKAQIGGIAQRLGYSRRTLARRLAQEGLTFSDIVERLRNDLARQYLTDHGLSISQVAWLVGYREVSAFTHAFKRWTGETPRAARASRHAAPH